MKVNLKDNKFVRIYFITLCSRSFCLAIGRNSSLPSIGRKGRVLVRYRRKRKKTLHTRLGPSSKTLHNTVSKQRSCKTSMETCAKSMRNKPASKLCQKTIIKMTLNKDYTFSGWKWATMPQLWEHLSNGMEEWRRGRVNDLRGKGSQGTHMGSITIGREGVS